MREVTELNARSRCRRRARGRRRASVARPPIALFAGLLASIVHSPPRLARATELPGERHALPCRPTIACTADLVVPGAAEIEMGALYRRLGSGARQWTFPFLLKLTLAEWVQVQVGSNGYSLIRGPLAAEYLDDLTAGVKLHLLDQRVAVPSLSLSVTASAPTFREAGDLRTYDAFLTLYVTKDLGPVHADLNAGENVWRIEGDPRPQGWIALALSIGLPAPFGAMAEAYYFTDAAPIATRDGGFLFALSHSPAPWLVFDAGADLGFFPGARAYSLFVGVTWVPVLLWAPRP